MNLIDCFRGSPEPRGIDVRIAGHLNETFLQNGPQWFEISLGLLKRRIEGRLIILIERRNADRSGRGVQYLFLESEFSGILCDDRKQLRGCDQLRSQTLRVWAICQEMDLNDCAF